MHKMKGKLSNCQVFLMNIPGMIFQDIRYVAAWCAISLESLLIYFLPICILAISL